MFLRSLLSLFVLFFMVSCASMFHGERNSVKFRGGHPTGTTKISSPDGTFDVENGQGIYMMTRSKSDIQLRITCPDGTKKSKIAHTSYDWSLGWMNIFNYGIGFFEALGDRAYDVDDVNLMDVCPDSGSTQKN